MRLLILHVIVFCAPISQAVNLDAIKKNQEGIENLQKESPYLAYRNFVEALGHEPFRPELKINLGISYLINEEFAKAHKEFLSAHRMAKTPEVKFYALFNAAAAKASDKKIDQALEYYQQALELKPDSKEVKTNIELLVQSSGGSGEGDQESDNKEGEGKGQSNNENQNQEGKPQQQKQKPKPFKSENLTKNDVRKILEELKDQEQKIRAKEYSKGRKDKANAKDW